MHFPDPQYSNMCDWFYSTSLEIELSEDQVMKFVRHLDSNQLIQPTGY